MKKIRFMQLLVLSALGLVIATPSNAGELLIGARIGTYNIEFNERDDSSPFVGIALEIGYEFLQMRPFNLSAEFEYTTSFFEGERNNQDYSFDSAGGSVSLRTNGNTYFISRIGVLAAQLKFNNSTTEDDNAGLLGFGIGFGKTEIELDLIQYQDTEYEGILLTVGRKF